nr:alpha/beta hydrolase [Maricaulis parjimensis]
MHVRQDRALKRDSAGQVVLRDGTPMVFSDTGSGPVILAVHGWAASRSFFADLADRLGDRYRVIVPDLRAHGDTPAGSLPLDIDTLAADLAELMDKLELDHVVLIGWSMGAMIAWAMIRQSGVARLSGLVVEDMTPRVLNDTDWSLGMASGLNASGSARATDLMRANWPAYAAGFAPRLFASGSTDAGLVRETAEELSRRDGEAMAVLWSSMTSQDMRPALGDMSLPILVAHGAESAAYGPETSRYLVDTLPQADRLEFAHSGHTPHLEQAEEFAHAVDQFASRILAGAEYQRKIEGSISP